MVINYTAGAGKICRDIAFAAAYNILSNRRRRGYVESRPSHQSPLVRSGDGQRGTLNALEIHGEGSTGAVVERRGDTSEVGEGQ